MGFSLYFDKFKDGEAADADRSSLKDFLKKSDLTIEDSTLVDSAGNALEFDGRVTELHIDSDSEEPLSGGIDYASLSNEECEFIFDLCTAVGWLIINPQGNPMTIIPNRNHSVEDLHDSLSENEEEIAWVNDAVELQMVLSEDFTEFSQYRDKVIGLDESEHSK